MPPTLGPSHYKVKQCHALPFTSRESDLISASPLSVCLFLTSYDIRTGSPMGCHVFSQSIQFINDHVVLLWFPCTIL